MFKTILVPLDGSVLAEQALLPAGRIAEKFGSELLLLRVVPSERARPSLPYLPARADSDASFGLRPLMEEAQAYLNGLNLSPMGVRVRTQALLGAPPEMIIATAADGAADLIVMSTHGRAGLMRLLYGSVAEAVLRGATVPVLLVPSRVLARREADSVKAAGARPRGSKPVSVGPV